MVEVLEELRDGMGFCAWKGRRETLWVVAAGVPGPYVEEEIFVEGVGGGVRGVEL